MSDSLASLTPITHHLQYRCMYDRILLPVDGSNCSLAAAKHGFELAQTHDADVHILHVINLDAYRTYFDMDVKSVEDGMVNHDLKQKGKKITHQAATLAENSDFEITETVVFGRPYKRILKYAKENDIDAIVMGTTGKSNLKGMVLGSVSHSVSQASNVPVILIRDMPVSYP
jgi:nucleotide-binding universal stress UspA family protein